MQSSLFLKRKLLACVTVLIACLAAWHTSAWAQVDNATQGTSFTDLQTAIDAASNGDLITIDAGTLTPDGTVTIDKPLSIQGAGSAHTTIDIGGFNAWGIYITANNVSLSGVNIVGNADVNQQFALKAGSGNNTGAGASICQNLTYTDITIQGTKRTAIDLNGVMGATLTDIEATGATSGFGMSISSSSNVTITNLTTSGNAWGDVGIFPANSPYQWPELEAPSNIVFTGALSLSDGMGSISVQDGLLQSGGTWTGSISNDPSNGADVTVPAAFSHVVNSERDADGLVLHNVGTQAAVHATASALAESGAFSGTTILNIDAAAFEVIEGLAIQDAIDAASNGDIIEVKNGTYPLDATLNVNKSVSVIGESMEGVILDASAMTPLAARVIETDADNIALGNLTIRPIADPDPHANNNIGFTIKAGSNSVPAINDGLVLENITIDGSAERTPFDFHGLDNVSLTNLNASGTTRGNGMSFSGCTNVTVDGFNGTDNAWGSIAVYASRFIPEGGRGSSNIAINGQNLAIDGAVFSQHDLDPVAGDLLNTDISVNGWDYVVYNDEFRGAYNDSEEYTFFAADETAAVTTALALQGEYNMASTVQSLVDSDWIVSNGMSIQEAVEDAEAGQIVVVGSGIYSENLVLDKAVELRGPGFNTACEERETEAVLAPSSGLPIQVTSDGVSINGFEITAPAYQYAIVCGGTSDLAIKYNHIHDINSAVNPASNNTHAIQYTVANAPAMDEGVFIEHNCIDHIGSTNLTGRSASAISFLQSTTTGELADLYIMDNRISEVRVNSGAWPTGKIAYGILINAGGGSGYLTSTGKVVDAIIADNEISGLSGHIATGIGLEGNTESAWVRRNDVSDLSATKLADRSGGGMDLQALKFENNRFVETITVEENRFAAETFTHDGVAGLGYAIANYVPVANGGVSVAQCNWLGSSVAGEIGDNDALNGRVFNKEGASIEPIPYLTDDGDSDAATGFQPFENACDGFGIAYNLTQSTGHLDLQEAIDLATEGDVIEIAAGSHMLGATLNLNKALTLQGESEEGTVLVCADLVGAYGIAVSAASCTLQDMTVDGAGEAVFGIHIQPGTSNIHLSGITAENCVQNGISLTGTTNTEGANTITDITVRDNGLTGLGLGASQYVTISDVTASGNAGSDIGMYIGDYEGQRNDHIAIEEPLNLAAGISYTIEENDPEGFEITPSTADETDALYNAEANVTVPASWNHLVIADVPEGALGIPGTSAFTVHVFVQEAAYALAAAGLGQIPIYTNIAALSLESGHWVVAPGMDLQAAIDRAAEGDTIDLTAGTHAPASTTTVNKALTLQGAGSDLTTLALGDFDAYGVHIVASDVHVNGLTALGNPEVNHQYLFKVGTGSPGPCENLSFNDLRVGQTKRTAFDFNGVNGANLTDIEAFGATSGFGLTFSSSQDITVTNLTTSGNAWGDVGIFPAQPQYQSAELEAPGNIVFTGALNLSDGAGSISVQDGALQSGGTWVGTISNNADDNADVTVPAAFNRVVNATRDYDGLVLHNVGTQSAIYATAIAIAESGAFSGTTIEDLDGLDLEVIEGLSIQDAVDAAEADQTISLLAGNHSISAEVQIPADLPVRIEGAGREATTITATESMSYGISVYANGVELDGFGFDGNGLANFGIHVKPGVSGFSANALSASNCGENGLSFTGVNGAEGGNTVTDLVGSGNGKYLIGMGATQDLAVTNVDGGAIGVYLSSASSDQVTQNVTLNAPITLTSGIVIEKGAGNGDQTITYSTANAAHADYSAAAGVTVPESYDHAIHSALYDIPAYGTTIDVAIVTLVPEAVIGLAAAGLQGLGAEDVAIRNMSAGKWTVLEGLSIQAAIDLAATGDLIDVAAGTFSVTESILVDKRLTLQGTGETTAIASSISKALVVTAGGESEEERLVIRDLAFTGASSSGGSDGISFEPASGTAGHVTIENVTISNHGQAVHFRTGNQSDARILNSTLTGNGNGVRVASAVTSMDGLSLDGCAISNSRSSAFSVNPSGVLENVHTNYSIANSTFTNNSTAGVANQHDLSFYGFTGNATLNNVTVTSGNGAAANANAYGIVFTRGGSDFSPLGTVSLTDVTVQGHVGKGALSFQQYSEISGVTLTNVDLTDCVAPWGQLILAHTDSDDFAVGNTALATVAIWNTGGADATSATFYNALTDEELSRDAVADGFICEDQIGHRIDLSALGLVTWKPNTLFVTANSFAPPYTAAPSIQRAADAAAAGDIIHVGAGTYPENVTTAVPLTIEGAGTTTIIQPASGNAITLAAGASATERAVLKNVKVTGGVRGVTAGGFTTLEGVEATGNSGAGLWLNAGADLVLDNCAFDANNLGVKIPSTVSFDNITITDCSFDDNTLHGWYSDANSGSEPSLNNVTITRSSFSGNGTKGLYTERLSNATFTELTVAGNGGNAGGVIGQGIDLNLKWADYANISVTNSAFSGNGLGQTMGAALAIKARDDGSTYGANPATLTQVTVSGNTFTGDERAIMLGEPNQTNAGPTAVTINENSFPDAVQFAVVNHAAEEVALTCNWQDAASIPGLNATVSGNVDISSALLAGTDGDAATAGFQPSGICTDIGGCGLAAACNYTADLAFPDNSDCEYTSCAGCTLSSACNYDATATVADNANCQFEDALGVCGGDCTSDANDDGICDSEASGCTDATACNYNAFAGQDDGSCEFSSCAGCTSEPACNYNAAATIPAPATCVFPEGCDTCSGATDGTGTVVDNDADNDGVCDADEVEGCTDPQACDYDENATEQTTCDYSSCAGCALPAACNYDAAATISNNASCIFADGCETCSGATDGTGTVVDNDSDDDGVCDDDEVDGCTDPTACDYNPNATDSTACDYASCIGCLNPTACNYDPDATQTGDCTFAAAFSNCDGCINDVNDNQVCDELEQTGCTDPAAVNFNPLAVIDDGSCTSELVGCTIPWAPNYNAAATVQGTPVLDVCYPATSGLPGPPMAAIGCSDVSACNYDTGGDPSQPCDYSCFGCTNAAACDYSADAVYNTGCTDFTSCYGCTTSTACNYEADNTFDDGSCEYASCAGCTDNTACNYDPTATINLPATCVIPTGCDTCSGGAIVDNDADNDGVCDADEVDGCMNANACNYDVNATDSDGSCEFTSCVGCTDSAACNYDASATIADAVNCVFATGCDSCSGATDGTGTVVDGDSDNDSVCDIDEVAGCMNASACNYDATATDSDGSCEFVSCVGCTDATACNYDDSATINEPVTCTYATGCDTCSGATDGTGTVVDGDSDNDNVCNADEVSGCLTPGACNYNPAATDAATCDFSSCQGCTDSSACNYDATATQSDGSCTYPPTGYDDCAGTICTDANNNSVCDFDESPVLGCMTSTACNYNAAANTNDPSNPCVYLVFEGFSSVTPSSGNRAADGGVTPIISGLGGSGTYFLSLDGAAVETSADGTKVYRTGLTSLEGNVPAASWGQLPAGRYTFGLLDDTGCEATATHTVLIPQLTP